MHSINTGFTLAIVTFLALTDLQNDRLITLAIDCILHIVSAVRELWETFHPLVLVFISGQLAYYQYSAKKARKDIVSTITDVAADSKADRVKILSDIQDNTQINIEAIETANGHNEKIIEITELIKSNQPKNDHPTS